MVQILRHLETYAIRWSRQLQIAFCTITVSEFRIDENVKRKPASQVIKRAIFDDHPSSFMQLKGPKPSAVGSLMIRLTSSLQCVPRPLCFRRVRWLSFEVSRGTVDDRLGYGGSSPNSPSAVFFILRKHVCLRPAQGPCLPLPLSSYPSVAFQPHKSCIVHSEFNSFFLRASSLKFTAR